MQHCICVDAFSSSEHDKRIEETTSIKTIPPPPLWHHDQPLLEAELFTITINTLSSRRTFANRIGKIGGRETVGYHLTLCRTGTVLCVSYLAESRPVHVLFFVAMSRFRL